MATLVNFPERLLPPTVPANIREIDDVLDGVRADLRALAEQVLEVAPRNPDLRRELEALASVINSTAEHSISLVKAQNFQSLIKSSAVYGYDGYPSADDELTDGGNDAA